MTTVPRVMLDGESYADDTFGGLTKAAATHFSDGGVFDQIYQPGS